MTAITVDPRNETFSSVEGALFDKGTNKLLRCPEGKGGAYAIPNSVTAMASDALLACTTLTNFTISAFLTAIDESAFFACPNLLAIRVDTNNPTFASFEGVLFDKSRKRLIKCPQGRTGAYAVPDGVVTIEAFAFESCVGLRSVSIPNSATSMGYAAFIFCTNLASVTIPSSVATVRDLFIQCANLARVYMKGNPPIYTFQDQPFQQCPKAVVFYLPGNTNWGTSYAGVPTALWQPEIESSETHLGVRSNQFGLTVAWASGTDVAVNCCTNLTNPTWQPITTNKLPVDTWHFIDPAEATGSARFYRLRWPEPTQP
jgi:hypothetical protein